MLKTLLSTSLHSSLYVNIVKDHEDIIRGSARSQIIFGIVCSSNKEVRAATTMKRHTTLLTCWRLLFIITSRLGCSNFKASAGVNQ